MSETRMNFVNTAGKVTVKLRGTNADIVLGGNGQSGDVFVRSSTGKDTVQVRGKNGDIVLGGNGQSGDVFVRTSTGKDTIQLRGRNADIVLGGNGQAGDVFVRNADGKDTIQLAGAAGDIVLRNGDCAEDFDVDKDHEVPPGTLVVLNEAGALQPCQKAYDRCAVGVIAGAGGYKPGIILDRQPEMSNRSPVALFGKAFCKVDAQYGAIMPGDLLTTSATPGHAMKVEDPLQAIGSIVGKALAPLAEGTGLVPMLVVLQ